MAEALLSSLRRAHALDDFIGNHPHFRTLVSKLENLAGKNIAVLLIGETGTGKGRCAEFIHQYSDRYNKPFIPYNCGAGPDSLFESQVFGHVRGAFTGAISDHAGLVAEADTGILFLDEINSLDSNSQVKLNHFLETGCYRRVGETRLHKADVRIIAASNINLKNAVRDGAFREDLYYRLAEYELCVPPLRARRADIPLLASYFLKKNAHLASFAKVTLSRKVIELLTVYTWPGNIRELENIIKRCLVDATSPVIQTVPLPAHEQAETQPAPGELNALPWKEAKSRVVDSFERNYLCCLLRKYQGIVARCARHAGIRSSDFWKLLRKYDIKVEQYR